MENVIVKSTKKHTTIVKFVEELQEKLVFTGVVHFDDRKGIITTNPVFNKVAEEILALPDFDKHEAVFIHYDHETKCLFFVFVHNTVRGQGQGGTRYMRYNTMNELLQEGLRLSKAMTEKNAVADLWWGGAKAIICPLDELEPVNGRKRELIFRKYGAFVASLNGIYIAAEDMNTNPNDMLQILSVCRFVTCLPPDVGGSSNPSAWTARGVYNAIRATLTFYEGSDNLIGKTVGIQGLGNVGMPLAKLLLDNGASIVAYDPRNEPCEEISSYSNRVILLANENDIYSEKIDIFSPCARGAIINMDTIPLLKATYVIGAANNQLKSPIADAKSLADRDIIYLPDYFVNRMGIFNCANEQYGWVKSDLESEVGRIYMDTIRLLSEAKNKNLLPLEIATKEAAEKAIIKHPIWGHRGVLLLKEIISNYK